jgi:hypothetical protein
MPLDFSLSTYRQFLNALKNYEVYTVRRFLEEQPSRDFVILRHDVDRMPGYALRISQLENEFKINSTYYFRYNKKNNWRHIMKAVSDQGHEVGYHYETLSKARGDHEAAIKMFTFELEDFRKICDVKTVSMHGKPLSKYINDKIWEKNSFEEYGIIGDSGLSILGIPYFTDTGRSWDNRNNIRDYIKTPDQSNTIIRTTNDLITLLSTHSYSTLYISTHPERWSGNTLEWLYCYSRDLFFNSGKSLIRLIRK